MGPTQDDRNGLVPIDAAARTFGIRASTLRYYDERGIVSAHSRHRGRRWYGPAEMRRIGAVRFWQQNGQMSLDAIASILDDTPSQSWPEIMNDRIADIDRQIDDLVTAKAALKHILEHHPDSTPTGCPHYEELISPPLETCSGR